MYIYSTCMCTYVHMCVRYVNVYGFIDLNCDCVLVLYMCMYMHTSICMCVCVCVCVCVCAVLCQYGMERMEHV